VRNLRLLLLAVAACVVAGCASPTVHQTSSHTTQTQRVSQTTSRPPDSLPQTTLQPPSTAGSGIARPGCASGTATVTAAPGGQQTPVCVTVGSVIVLQGGNVGSGGTWPGPAQVSDSRVVSVVSLHSAGPDFTAQLTAKAPGTASVIVPFVAGNEVCDPTPCTPIPGAPLDFAVKVIS
jgi:hypothetical protein